jgi:hypothetical protein
VKDELRLAAEAFQRHHRGARRVGGGIGPEIAANEMQARVDAARGPGRRQ